MSTCSGLMDFFPANFMLQPPNENDHQSLSLHGIAPMLGKRSVPFQGVDPFHEEANGGGGGGGGSGEEDNLSDDGSQAIGEKKRRLNIEQVKTLEKNFELGNKLEPERKLLLAKALGLQPRQIAIWFQNRRARCKTKQLEKDYVILKRQFESLKADNESLLARNHKLQTEILTLKGREPIESINLNKETDQGSCSNRSETSSEIKLDISTRSTAMKAAIGGAIDSPLSDHHPTSNRAFFPPHPPCSAINRPDGPSTRLFQGPPMARSDLHYQRFDHTVKEEGLNNMFCGIDDQSGYWPWIDQHHSFN